MTRTGDARVRAILFALAAALVALPLPAHADDALELYQTADRTELGIEDTLRVTVVLQNAPRGSKLELPAFEDFEVLSRSPMEQTSINMSGGQTQILRITQWVIVLRPQKLGKLTIAPSTLHADGQKHATKALTVTVRPGSLAPPQAQAPGGSRRGRVPDPFADLFGPGGRGGPGGAPGGGINPFGGFPEPEIPRTDSDLFVRTYLDTKEAYVGQQVTMTVYLFSRVDVASVERVTFPQLEGFWSEDIDSPTNLTSEQRTINGVSYRAYLLKRKALFPTRAGTLEIEPVQAEVTTGFLFAGHKVSRKGNTIALEVKPLPSGSPDGFTPTNVGRWKLSMDVTPQEITLGDPLTVRVFLEGRGNVKNVPVPRVVAPPSFRVYEPTTTDKVTTRSGAYGGRRTQEYVVMPSQTGTFTLPELTFPFFNPETRQYETARTEPITVKVNPPAGGAQDTLAGNGATGATGTGSGATDGIGGPKNLLTPDGIHPLRHVGPGMGSLVTQGPPPWREGWFLPVVLSPLGLWAALGLIGLARTRLGKEDAGAVRRKQAKAARRRLSEAEKLRVSGSAEAFFAEVERSVHALLQARFGEPFSGLTHASLEARLANKGVPEETSKKVRSVLETCELGRYAPGAADMAARERLLEDAEAALEALERR